jgi:hypothetical protein
MAGLGLTLTPATASADFLDFTVVEGTVPDASTNTITADQVTGVYQEIIEFDGFGNFEATLWVSFNNYQSTEGTVDVPDQLGNFSENQYLLYASVIATGTVTGTGLVGDPFLFEPTDAEAYLYVDPNSDTAPTNLPGDDPYDDLPTLSNTGDDYLIMSATEIDLGGSFGQLTGGPTVDEDDEAGLYQLIFTNPTLSDFGTLLDGQSYWPTLTSFGLRAITDGDFDDADLSDGTLTGQTSLVFDVVVVPEPATLSLLGIGLLGVGIAARRRRKA